MTEKLREIEVFDPKNREWRPTRLIEVKRGQLFRMWDYSRTGSKEYADQLVSHKGRTEFFAKSDAFLNDKGIATIMVDE